jgi:hypothetical protein
MRRPDLARLVGYAANAGLTVALTPSGTAAATPSRLAELARAGPGARLEIVEGEGHEPPLANPIMLAFLRQ